MNKLNPQALGVAAAVVSGLGMATLGILGNLGIYMNAVTQMQKWHLFFDLSFIGILGGILEAAVISFVICYIFAYIYNKVLR